MYEKLKRYDRYLSCERKNDGTIDVFRQSPFDKEKKHTIIPIRNQYVGSGKWVLQKLISMDTTRHDLFGDAKRHNWKIREKKDSKNMHEDLADFIISGGSTFVN